MPRNPIQRVDRTWHDIHYDGVKEEKIKTLGEISIVRPHQSHSVRTEAGMIVL